MRLHARDFAVVLVLSTAIIGCAQAKEVEAPAPVLPDTPDGTIRAVAEQLADGKPEIMWIALPESYRNDLTELTHGFAAKIDPQLYDRSLAVARRGVEVLQEKKDLILQSQTLAMTDVDPEEMDQILGSVLGIAHTLLSSEITTLQGLQTVDWGNYLATTGTAVMEQVRSVPTDDGDDPLADLKTVQVEVLESSDDTAVVRLSMADEEPEEVPMTRVEGRWVPQELVDGWSEGVDEARRKIDELSPEQMEEIKGQALMGLAMAEGVIEQVAAVETVEQFDELIGPMIEAIMGSVANAMPQQPAEPMEGDAAE
jgi:hypothetical protein